MTYQNNDMGLVYLAGPIAGVSGVAAVDWRNYAGTKLARFGIKSRNPMRSKPVLKEQDIISSDYRSYLNNGLFYTSKAIITRDFNDVKQCDILLVNLLNAPKPSLGTIMELAWAYAMQKPAVVVIEQDGNPHDHHPMIHEVMPFRVPTLDEGILAVATILGVNMTEDYL